MGLTTMGAQTKIQQIHLYKCRNGKKVALKGIESGVFLHDGWRP